MSPELFHILLLIALFAMIMALFITLIRLLIGPHIVDRIITFDLMTANLIGIIGIYSIYSGDHVFLDVGVVLALISFFALIAFSFYLNKKEL